MTHAGLVFVGPSPENIEAFGLKHTARRLATDSEVPIVPGSGLVTSEDEAVEVARKLGFPVCSAPNHRGGGVSDFFQILGHAESDCWRRWNGIVDVHV